MDILIAANLHPQHNFTMERQAGVRQGLSDHRLQFMDILDFWGDPDRAIEMEEAIANPERRARFFNQADVLELNQLFLDRVGSYQWDWLWLCTVSHFAQFLLPQTIRQLRKWGRVIAFMGDDELYFDTNRFWCPLFDAVVGYTEREVAGYTRWNAQSYYLPIGVPLIDPPPVKKEFDGIVFVGRPYGSRAKTLEQLKGAGLPLQIYGPAEWRRFRNLGSSYQGFLDKAHFWKVLSQSSLILNLMESQDGGLHLNAKVFEAAAVGSLAISNPYSPFISSYGLDPDEDIVFFDDLDDLISKATFLLDNPSARQERASNLQRKLQAFRYDNLYAELTKQLMAADLSAQAAGGEFLRRQWTGGFKQAADSAQGSYKAPSHAQQPPAKPAASAWSLKPGLEEERLPGASSESENADRKAWQARFIQQDSQGISVDESAARIALQAVRAGLELGDGLYFDSLLPSGRHSSKPIFTDSASILWNWQGWQKFGPRLETSAGGIRVFLLLRDQVLELLKLLGLRFLLAPVRFLLGNQPDLLWVPIMATRIESSRLASRLERYQSVAKFLHRMRDRLIGLLCGH
jgi:hypothetical protein